MATPVEELTMACNAAIRFYEAVSRPGNPDMTALPNLTAVAGELKSIFDKLGGNDNAKDLSNPGTRAGTVSKLNGAIDESFNKIKARIPPDIASGSGVTTTTPATPGKPGTEDDRNKDSDDMVPMEDFFDTISTSLMKAQTELNRRSLDYVTNLD